MTYNLIKKENFDKLNLEVFLYEHEKTKANVIYVNANDTNKTFGIGFKTPPVDSKGKAHIMEHSVLNGSKKYKTKDPFMDMASSSLQTFLNAMTYPDKTVYPVSSENEKDFYNLVDVYLDAVFNPLVLEKKEILDQEGWHYELEDDKVTGISGVVYNEMKGALSDPESLIYNDIKELLYKGSCYEYESGGNPDFIGDLTYDEFLDFYKNHYHPSNSYIYFYGDMDIKPLLDNLDKEYLSKYDYKDIDTEIKVKENFYPDIIEGSYPASKIEENSDYLSYAFLASSALDAKEYLTLSIIVNTIFNMDSSKIRTEIAEKLNPEYFYARPGYGNRSSVLIQAQKVDGEKIEEFVDIIETGIKNASEKISEESLKSAFSIFDFAQRENLNDVNRGLSYYLMMSFDADPLSVFKLVDILDELRSLIGTSYYEDFIKKYFLENKTRLIHIARPDKSYAEKKAKAFNNKLKVINESMDKESLEKIKADLDNLSSYQNRENTPEEKATIPRLDIKDVPTSLPKTPREVIDNKYIYHNLETSGMIYTNMYFNIDHLSLEEMQYAQLINEFLGSVDTKNISYRQIDDVIWQYLTGLNFTISNIRLYDKNIENNIKVTFKTTRENIGKSTEIIKDFLTNTIFNNQKRIVELLRIRKSIFESGMYDSGHLIALNRSNSHIDKLTFIKEKLSGIDYYLFIKDSINEATEDFESFKKKIEDIYKKLFTKNVEFNITSAEDDFYLLKDEIENNFDFLIDPLEKKEITFDKKPIKEAILSDANVNYVSKSADLREFDLRYDGKFSLASSIISNPYLYELIRAKGGAYGAGMLVDRSGLFGTYSYRDPNIKLTLDNYDKIPEICENINMNDRDFENQQISTMGNFLRPKTPAQKADSDFLYYKKKSAKTEEEILKEIKEAKLEDIKQLSDAFSKALAVDNICVFGNRDKILENKDLFDRIIDLND